MSQHPTHIARRQALLVLALVAAAIALAGGQFEDPRTAGVTAAVSR